MKRSSVTKVIIWILVLMMVASPTLAATKENKVTIVRANLTLDEMPYDHIEYKEVDEKLNEAKAIIKQNDEQAFYKWENTYYSLYCKLQAMIQLIHLKYELNTDQKEYFEEYLYSVDLLGKMKSGYTALFEEEGGSLSQAMSTYYDLSIQRSKLVDAYYEKQLSVTIEMNGEKKSITQILSSQTLSRAEKLTYYDKWYGTYNEVTGEIFLKLVAIDNQMAKLEGYDSYAAYMYEGYEREYSLADS